MRSCASWQRRRGAVARGIAFGTRLARPGGKGSSTGNGRGRRRRGTDGLSMGLCRIRALPHAPGGRFLAGTSGIPARQAHRAVFHRVFVEIRELRRSPRRQVPGWHPRVPSRRQGDPRGAPCALVQDSRIAPLARVQAPGWRPRRAVLPPSPPRDHLVIAGWQTVPGVVSEIPELRHSPRGQVPGRRPRRSVLPPSPTARRSIGSLSRFTNCATRPEAGPWLAPPGSRPAAKPAAHRSIGSLSRFPNCATRQGAGPWLAPLASRPAAKPAAQRFMQRFIGSLSRFADCAARPETGA